MYEWMPIIFFIRNFIEEVGLFALCNQFEVFFKVVIHPFQFFFWNASKKDPSIWGSSCLELIGRTTSLILMSAAATFAWHWLIGSFAPFDINAGRIKEGVTTQVDLRCLSDNIQQVEKNPRTEWQKKTLFLSKDFQKKVRNLRQIILSWHDK